MYIAEIFRSEIKIPLTSSLLLHVPNQCQLLPLRHRCVRIVARCWLWCVHLVAKAGFGGVHIVAGHCFGGVWIAAWCFGGVQVAAWCGDAAWGSTARLSCLLKKEDIQVRQKLLKAAMVESITKHFYLAGGPILSSRPHCSFNSSLHLCKWKMLRLCSSTHLFVGFIWADFNTYRCKWCYSYNDSLTFWWQWPIQFDLGIGL